MGSLAAIFLREPMQAVALATVRRDRSKKTADGLATVLLAVD